MHRSTHWWLDLKAVLIRISRLGIDKDHLLLPLLLFMLRQGLFLDA